MSSFPYARYDKSTNQILDPNKPINMPYILAQSGAPASVTGTLAETTLMSVTIPGGALGPNGAIRINAGTSGTNNANSKLFNIKLNGAAVNGINIQGASSGSIGLVVANRNSTQAQHPRNIGHTATTGVGGIFNVNTDLDTVLTITGTLGSIGDTMTLEDYTVEILPGG